jgi:bifunctional non-homologous end joining protein LigD
MPEAIRRVTGPERKGDALYPAIDDVEGLLGLVQIGVLEIHPWGARADDVEHPDRIVFDLDPDTDLAWGSVVEAAFEIRARLKAHGLESFVKTTGGKGLHVVAPVERSHDWAEVKGFSKALALAAVKDSPERYTATLAKSARQGKIFIDYLRNDRGSTAVAAYSPRARPGAPVASPVAWTALRRLPGSNAYTVETLPRRLARLRDDPWEGIDRLRQRLPKGQSKA